MAQTAATASCCPREHECVANDTTRCGVLVGRVGRGRGAAVGAGGGRGKRWREQEWSGGIRSGMSTSLALRRPHLRSFETGGMLQNVGDLWLAKPTVNTNVNVSGVADKRQSRSIFSLESPTMQRCGQATRSLHRPVPRTNRNPRTQRSTIPYPSEPVSYGTQRALMPRLWERARHAMERATRVTLV